MDEETLAREAATIGVRLSEAQSWELLFHLQAVIRANERVNLTAVTDIEEAVAVHVLDSLTAVRVVDGAPPGPVADMGSGAGFPGVPIAVVLDRPVSLIESRGKRAAFLRTVSVALDHDITVLPMRAEEVGRDRSGTYAAVTARAVASLPALVELAAPLLMPGGLFVAMKGDLDPTEAERGDAVAELVGLSPGRLEEVFVQGLDARRVLVVYERVRESELGLPRRPGMAQKRPLA